MNELIGTECGICIEEIKRANVFPCKHGFCSDCVKTHLKSSNKCPMCRQNIMEPEEAIQQCIMRTNSLLTLLELNLRKLMSCETPSPFNGSLETKKLLQDVNKMANELGLGNEGFIWEWPIEIPSQSPIHENVNITNWINRLLDNSFDS
jgi:hypothetical protein